MKLTVPRVTFSNWGAPMGRPSDTHLHGKCRLQILPLVDGDYDAGGAYWGFVPRQPMWICQDPSGSQAFVRASTRGEAKALLNEENETPLTFWR